MGWSGSPGDQDQHVACLQLPAAKLTGASDASELTGTLHVFD